MKSIRLLSNGPGFLFSIFTSFRKTPVFSSSLTGHPVFFQSLSYLLKDGVAINLDLTPLEFKILYQLAKHEEHILSRKQLLDQVWGDSADIFDRTVDTHVSALRRKMGALAFYIQSVSGEGYRFSTEQRSKTAA